MFGRIWIILILCTYLGTTNSSVFISENSILDNVKKFRVLYREVAHNAVEETNVKDANRTKRGIVLVDEDFDVPPRNIDGNENSDDIFEHVGHKTTLDGSGDGTEVDAEKEVPKKTTKEDPNSESDHWVTNETTSTQFVPEVTKPIEKLKTISTPKLETELESSGDGIFYTNEPFTTEKTTEINIGSVNNADEQIPDICLNYTCSSEDLLVRLSEDTTLIPEGTNLTLSCISNSSNQNMLYWYGNNGSTYFLQAFGSEPELHLTIERTKTFHSGMYLCVKWISREYCCNIETYVTVYEVPFYKYHLIVLALITATLLIVCIFLAVRQTMALKTYKKQFAKKHGNVQQQLL